MSANAVVEVAYHAEGAWEPLGCPNGENSVNGLSEFLLFPQPSGFIPRWSGQTETFANSDKPIYPRRFTHPLTPNITHREHL